MNARKEFMHDLALVATPNHKLRKGVKKAAIVRITNFVFAPKGMLCPVCGERVVHTRRTAQQDPKPSEQVDYINTHTCTKCPWLRVINDNGHVLQSRTPDPTEES